jgi:hypothetical protein
LAVATLSFGSLRMTFSKKFFFMSGQIYKKLGQNAIGFGDLWKSRPGRVISPAYSERS